MANFLHTIDLGLRTILYDKFGDILGISSFSGTTEDKINKGVILYPKEVAQRVISEKKGDHFLEFINFWRTSVSFDWDRNRTIVSRRGINVCNADGDVVPVKAVPAKLEYNVSFWSKSRDTATDCLEQFLFWTHNYPKLSVVYNSLYTLDFELHFGGIRDESPVDQMFTKGHYTVFTAPLTVDAWVFETGSVLGEIEKIQLTVYEGSDVTNHAEIYVQDSNQDTEMEAALRMLRSNLFRISSIDLTNNTLSVLGSFSGDFVVGRDFLIENSTDNDELYTITDVSQQGLYTVVTVDKALTSTTTDGNIYLKED